MTLKELYNHIGNALQKYPELENYSVYVPYDKGYGWVGITDEDLLFMKDDEECLVIIRSNCDKSEQQYDDQYDYFLIYKSSLSGQANKDRRSVCLSSDKKESNGFDEEYCECVCDDILTAIFNSKTSCKTILDFQIIGLKNYEFVNRFLEEHNICCAEIKNTEDIYTITILAK